MDGSRLERLVIVVIAKDKANANIADGRVIYFGPENDRRHIVCMQLKESFFDFWAIVNINVMLSSTTTLSSCMILYIYVVGDMQYPFPAPCLLYGGG